MGFFWQRWTHGKTASVEEAVTPLPLCGVVFAIVLIVLLGRALVVFGMRIIRHRAAGQSADSQSFLVQVFRAFEFGHRMFPLHGVASLFTMSSLRHNYSPHIFPQGDCLS